MKNLVTQYLSLSIVQIKGNENLNINHREDKKFHIGDREQRVQFHKRITLKFFKLTKFGKSMQPNKIKAHKKAIVFFF